MSTPDSKTEGAAGQAIQATVPATAKPDGAGKEPFVATTEMPAGKRPGTRRRWWLWGIGAMLLIAALIAGIPWVINLLNTVSTDAAYVNRHVTVVAPRAAGQVDS